MAATQSYQAGAELDAVHSRFETLRMIVEREHRTSTAEPLARRNLDVGLVQVGTKKTDAAKELDAWFLATQRQLRCHAVLELCTTFEQTVLRRLRTAIGEARTTLDAHLPMSFLRVGRAGLLRDSKSFESLQSIFDLFDSPTTARGKQLQRLRETRNSLAHGSLSDLPDDVTVESTRAILKELLADAFG